MIECKGVTIGYPEKTICKNISFSIKKGEYVCIVGENGCGKSTLLKTVLGLHKPLKGKIAFEKSFNKSSIGYLPQQTEMQKDFPATVKEIVLSGFLGKKKWYVPFYTRQEKAKCNTIMTELGVAEFANKSFKELSGGQQQRVLLARALCSSDELLIMDEPTNNLDSKSIKLFYKLIAKLNKENGITILMVTHDLDKAIKDVTNVLYLKDELKFAGTRDAFCASEYAKLFGVEEE
ncbi:MAG: metal ABC transporter ATP-binding protein [Clostridia bacterium]|nr:metal ABC transporter ATP-binding protein [Clostridia bacterium]